MLADRMKELNIPGVSIAVIHEGKIEWARGFGVSGFGGSPVTLETMFQAGSISKPLAASILKRDRSITASGSEQREKLRVRICAPPNIPPPSCQQYIVRERERRMDTGPSVNRARPFSNKRADNGDDLVMRHAS
jgi:hypothetical protein